MHCFLKRTYPLVTILLCAGCASKEPWYRRGYPDINSVPFERANRFFNKDVTKDDASLTLESVSQESEASQKMRTLDENWRAYSPETTRLFLSSFMSKRQALQKEGDLLWEAVFSHKRLAS